MSLLRRIFGGQQSTPAAVARERLQIIISHERSQKKPDYLLDLQKDIIKVIAKYIEVDEDAVNVKLNNQGENSVLELNVTMPEMREA